jgi:hypothetical protein
MARVKELMKDQRREAYLSRWPNVPLAIFKGRRRLGSTKMGKLPL